MRSRARSARRGALAVYDTVLVGLPPSSSAPGRVSNAFARLRAGQANRSNTLERSSNHATSFISRSDMHFGCDNRQDRVAWRADIRVALVVRGSLGAAGLGPK